MAIRCLGEEHGDRFSAYWGDCVDVLRQLPSESVDFSIYSPPFGSLFVYSESAADMGNSTDEEFAEHYGFLIREKFRLTKPGRISAVHCSDLPMTKWRDGAIGIKDFSGQIIRAHEDAGWILHSRRTIWKCPVVEMTRTKHVGLLYKQLQKDSVKSRGGMPDYLLTFLKPGENAEPIAHTPKDFPLDQWQEWASPVWMSVDQSNVLNVKAAKEPGDERHLCPLQERRVRQELLDLPVTKLYRLLRLLVRAFDLLRAGLNLLGLLFAFVVVDAHLCVGHELVGREGSRLPVRGQFPGEVGWNDFAFGIADGESARLVFGQRLNGGIAFRNGDRSGFSTFDRHI